MEFAGPFAADFLDARVAAGRTLGNVEHDLDLPCLSLSKVKRTPNGPWVQE